MGKRAFQGGDTGVFNGENDAGDADMLDMEWVEGGCLCYVPCCYAMRFRKSNTLACWGKGGPVFLEEFFAQMAVFRSGSIGLNTVCPHIIKS